MRHSSFRFCHEPLPHALSGNVGEHCPQFLYDGTAHDCEDNQNHNHNNRCTSDGLPVHQFTRLLSRLRFSMPPVRGGVSRLHLVDRGLKSSLVVPRDADSVMLINYTSKTASRGR